MSIDNAIDRYHRQWILPGIGADGQRRLNSSHALLVGCGALGCTMADLLTRGGVGTLSIIDRDVVELTNLQRQSLFSERDAREAMPKAEAAGARLRGVNSSIKIRPMVADFTAANAEEVLLDGALPAVGVILDGTDNFATRYLLNDLAVKHAIPFLYGGAVGTRGMTMSILPARDGIPATPCLRCLFPDCPQPGAAATCDTAGILGPVSTTVAAHQAAEAIKVLIGRPDLCDRSLTEFDSWTNSHRRLDVAGSKDPACPCCVQRRFEFLDGRAVQEVSVICTRTGGGAVQVTPERGAGAVIDLERLRLTLTPHGEFSANRLVLRGVLAGENTDGEHPIELTVFSDGRAIIRGTTEPAVARSIYARYIGA